MFSEYQQFSRTTKGEKVIHIQVCTVRRHFSEDKVMPLFSEQLVTDLQSLVSAWRTGWCNVHEHRIRSEVTHIDGWRRSVLPRGQAAAVIGARCPSACISVVGSLIIQLSISGHRVWLCATAGVTSAYSHNVCLLFSADALHNDSVCSTDASQRESDARLVLTDAFMGGYNGVHLNSSVFFFFFSLKRNSHFLQGILKNTYWQPFGGELRKIIRRNEPLVQGVLKAFHFISKIIDLENEMEQPGWGFLTNESKLD